MLKSPVMLSLMGIWLLIFGITYYIVSVSNTDKPILTEKDYYQQGLAYDSVLEAKHRAESVGITTDFSIKGDAVQFTITGVDSVLNLQQPDSVELFCMRYNDSSLDTLIVLEPKDANTWSKSGVVLKEGRWKLKLRTYQRSVLWNYIEQEYTALVAR